MADTPTKDERLEKCWTKWFEADFSWNGLAEKQIAGDGGLHGERTLQDYWRRDPETGAVRSDKELLAAGELVEAGRRHWHVVHLPPRLVDGAATWKADLEHGAWDRVEALISARLGAAQESSAKLRFGLVEVAGPDGRAQFMGTVQRREPRLLSPLNGGEETSDDTALHLDARFIVFLGVVNLTKATLGAAANFFDATFTANADFFDATFTADTNFFQATFIADANFMGTTFTGDANFFQATFTDDAFFFQANFIAEALFIRTTFTANVNFSSATFAAGALFSHATFTAIANFSGTEFSGFADFSSAHFLGLMKFTKVRFNRFANFKDIDGPNRETDWRNAFDGAIAFGTLDWRGAPYHMISAFSGAKLKEGIFYPKPGETEAERTFRKKALHPALRAGRAMPTPEDKNEKPPTRADRAKERDAALAALESGGQVLSLAMKDAKDKLREQRFYRFELIARRKQKTTKLAEKIFSWLYAFAADYGSSFVRPPLAVTTIVLAFGAGFWLWGEALQAAADLVAPGAGPPFALIVNGDLDPQFWDAIVFSGEHAFRPFGVWWPHPAMTGEAPNWARQFLDAFGLESEGGQRAAIRFVATLESLFAIVVFFLFGLAIRRRFQMD